MEFLWPVGAFSNAVFKTMLENIIVKDLEVDVLADEIRKKEEVTINNLDLNTNYLNEIFFENSPLKLVEGKIMSIRARFPKNFVKEKIEIVISDIYLIIAPSNLVLHQKPPDILTDTKVKKPNLAEGIINKVLHNLEFTVKNICIKLVTYDEIINNKNYNPTFTILIGQLKYSKFKDINISKFCAFNKKIQIDNFSIKLSETFDKEEIFYFNIINDSSILHKSKDSNERNKEKLFLLNNNSNTILTLTSKEENEYFSFRLKIFEDTDNAMKIQSEISNLEIIVNQKQMSYINRFYDVFSEKYKENYLNRVKVKVPNEMKQQTLLGTKLSVINLCFNLNLVNILVVEGTKFQYPKLWAFLDYKYPDKLDSSEKIEKHFSYFEENFYIFSIRNICLNSNVIMAVSSIIAELNLEDINAKYVIYKSKSPFEKYIPENITQNYENFNLDVKAMKNIDVKFYFDLYDKILNEKTEETIKNDENDITVLQNINLSQYLEINLSSYLNFYFKNNAFTLLSMIKPADVVNSYKEMFKLPTIFGVKYFSQIHKIIEKDKSPYIKSKTKLSLYLGEVFLEFHPIFMFSFLNLMNNSNFFSPKEIHQDITPKQVENSKKEILIVDENYEESEENTEIEIKYQSKFKFLIFLEKISIKFYTFKSESLNEFFNIFYFSSLRNVYNSNLPNYLEEIDKRSCLIIKIMEIEAIVNNLNENGVKETNLYLDFNKLLLLLKSKDLFPILSLINNYKEEKNDSIVSPVQNVDLDALKPIKKYITLFDNYIFKRNFSKNYDRLDKSYSLNLKILYQTGLSIKKEIIFYYNNSHNLTPPGENTILQEIDIPSKQLENLKNTLSIKLFLRSQINILLNNSYMLKTLDFIDNLQYTLNIFGYINSLVNQGKDESKTQNLTTSKNKQNFMLINVDLKELNIIIFKNVKNRYSEEKENQIEGGELMFLLIEDPFIKINISDISLNLFKYNQVIENLISIDNFKFFLKKNFKREASYENSKTLHQMFCLHKNEEENFIHILYKEAGQERLKVLTVMISVKTYTSNSKLKNFEDNYNENDLNFEKFLKKRMIKAPLYDYLFIIKLNKLVLTPIFEDFDIGYLLSIKTNIIDIINMVGQNIPKYKLLINESGSKINFRLDCSKCTIDLFSNYYKKSVEEGLDVKKNIYYKMRMVILLDNLIYEFTHNENIHTSCVSISKINLFLLRNLDHGANKLIFLNIKDDDFKSNYYLTRYGFTEVIYFDNLFCKLSKNNNLKKIEVEFVNEVIELTFCRDSIRCILQFLKFMQNILKDLLEKISSKDEEKIEQHFNYIKSEKLAENETMFNLNRKKNEDEINLEFRSIDDNQFDLSQKIEKKEGIKQEISSDFSKKFFCLFKFIKVFLYEGKDFVFEDKYEQYVDKNKVVEAEKKIEVEDDYFSLERKNTKGKNFERIRDPNQKRNFNRYIDFSFFDLEMNLKFNQYDVIPLNFNLQIYKFEISDNIKESIYNKMFTKNDFKNENPLIFLKIDLLNDDLKKAFYLKDRTLYEITVYLSLSSVNILIDQHTLFFIFRFFKTFKPEEVRKDKTAGNLSVKKNETVIETKKNVKEILENPLLNKIIIKKILIEEFFINFCYNTHKLQLKNTKDYLEILNITNLKDFKIFFKQHISQNRIILSDLFNELFQYWKDDINNNQIINSFISSISFLKPFNNVVESFFDIFRQPFYHSSVNEGAAKGFRLFFINISSELIYLGEKIFNFFDQFFAKQKTENDLSVIANKSKYDKFVHLMNEKKRLNDQYLLKN